MHAVEGFKVPLDALLSAARDSKRRQRELRELVDELGDDVRALVDQDRIAAGVAAKLNSRNDSRLRRWSFRVAIVGAILAGLGELAALAERILGL